MGIRVTFRAAHRTDAKTEERESSMPEAATARNQTYRQVAISTGAGEDVLLFRKATVVEHLSRLFQIEVDLLSENGDVPFEKVVGKPATIRLHQTQDSQTRYYSGVVSRFVHTGGTKRSAHYRMTIVPWFWLLTRCSDCRVHQGKTVVDIIKKVFDDRGFADYDINCKGPFETREFCVQYRETDFNFISRLMEEEGIYYYWKHEDGKHTMMIVDDLASHEPHPAYETINYYPYTEVSREQEYVWEWVVEQEVQPGMWDMRDYNFETPTGPMDAVKTVESKHEQGDWDMFEYPGIYAAQGEGERRSKMRLEEVHSAHEVIRGRGDVRGLMPGHTFTLAEHPRESQNKKYLVTSITSVIESDEYNSTLEGSDSGPVFRVSFTCMDAAKQFRARRVTPKPLINGCQTAVVSGPDGEEIHTDKYGRVKVQFHWDRDPGEGKNEDASCWMRVSQVWAGKGWGAIHIPRVGQEVIVDFLDGDPDRPIITGRVYHAQSMPPYSLPDNKTISGLKSSSYKGGGGFNELRFEDKKGEEQIFVHAQKQMDIRVKADRFEYIGNNRHLEVEKDKLEHVKVNSHVLIDNDHHVKVGRDHFLKVVGKQAIKVTGSHSKVVEGDVIEECKGKQSNVVTGDYYINADNICIHAKTNLTLKVGGSTIAIEADGVEIKGASSAAMKAPVVDVKADGPATLEGASTTVKGSGSVTVSAPSISLG
jgi:type VI secretion system secreted protein VgrG